MQGDVPFGAKNGDATMKRLHGKRAKKEERREIYIYKDFSIRKFVGQVNLDLTGMGHEAT